MLLITRTTKFRKDTKVGNKQLKYSTKYIQLAVVLKTGWPFYFQTEKCLYMKRID